MVRTFICVEIKEPELIDQINREINDVRLEGVRPVTPSQMHLTIKFLGEISTDQIEEVKRALKNIEFSPFNINLSEMGCFPNINYIKVIWIGISEGKEQLGQLANIIEDQLGQLGFPREKRDFSPHLTLARVRKISNPVKTILKRKIQDSKTKTFGNQYIEEFIFKKSTLTPKGPIYEDLQVVQLK